MATVGLAQLWRIAVRFLLVTVRRLARLGEPGKGLTHKSMVAKIALPRANPFADSFALTAMRAIWTHLQVACFEPQNRVAREGMMLAATQAGIAFSNSSVALEHGMGRPIGAKFHGRPRTEELKNGAMRNSARDLCSSLASS